MIKIYTASDTHDATIRKDVLKFHHIDAEIRGAALAGALGELPAPAIAPTLWVAAEQAHEAKKILHRYDVHLNTVKEDWRCLNCGEQVEGQFGECWNCGAPQV